MSLFIPRSRQPQEAAEGEDAADRGARKDAPEGKASRKEPRRLWRRGRDKDRQAPAGSGAAAPDSAAGAAGDRLDEQPGLAGADGAGRSGRRRRRPRAARVLGVVATVLAGLLILAVMLLPNRLDRMSVNAFPRIPVEALVLAALLVLLPRRARRITAVAAGVTIGLLTLVKFLDMGYREALARNFDLVFDWVLLDDAAEFVRESFGRTGQVLAVVGAVVLATAVLVLCALAVLRVGEVLARHRKAALSGTAVAGVVWVVCFTLGAQIGGWPIATKGYTQFVANRVEQVRDGLVDAKEFEKLTRVDAFADVPRDELLTGLRGKDVLLTFVESYGRTALEHPDMAPEMEATLEDARQRLETAGFTARSGWLRSPVTGAGSWLAHATFLSGLWVENQQRYRTLTTGERPTLTSYFRKTGAWRTVGIVPGVRKAWPEGEYFGLDHVYDSGKLGYNGPYFSWTPVPDQFSMEAFERLEHGRDGRQPIMAEIILASSHNPWSPVPRMLNWDELGDGSVFERIKEEGTDPEKVWQSTKSVRTEYRKAVQYSLESLTGWLERYGDDNTVMVFLGDHQPVPRVTGGSGNKDVPITLVARDPEVLDRIADWGWTEGLRPAPDAPVWPMDQFRDRFMTAYAK